MKELREASGDFMSKHIIVIGAGIGGLSAAIRLAVAGQRVTVLEKNASVGGKMGEVRRTVSIPTADVAACCVPGQALASTPTADVAACCVPGQAPASTPTADVAACCVPGQVPASTPTADVAACCVPGQAPASTPTADVAACCVSGQAPASTLTADVAACCVPGQAPASEAQGGGFRWDTGPSVITMRHVFEELFATAGRRLEDYIQLLPVEPLTRYFYPDGTVLDATRDLARMVEQIRRLDERDVEGYLAYLGYVARLHRVTGPAFIYGAPPTWRTVTQVAPADALRLEPWLTMDAAIRRYVRSPHLRQLLGRFATYVGGSPFRAPATLNVIAHVELNEGIWYPRGGVYAIAAALERLARELGVTIRTGCAVKQIYVPGTSEVPGTSRATTLRATGVLLANGERIAADAVLSNVDVAHTLTNLLPREAVDLRRLRGITRAEPSCSGFILLLGVRGEFRQLAQHNIFFSSDYRREFDDIFRRGVPPEEPTVYIAVTSKANPDHAPPGHENWFVLVNAPATGPAFDWEKGKAAYRDRVLATLARFGLDVRDRIVVEEVFTPADLARQTGSWRGALYGASPNNALAAFRRPPVRDPRVARLYYAGGTTHPGGGVPMVILSGKLAARTILQDLSSAI